MGGLATEEVLQFLAELGTRYPQHADLYLIGGGALCLLGSPRRTGDIDFSLPDTESFQGLIQTMQAVADDMQVELEVITIEAFVPVPKDATQRHQKVGRFGNLDVYIYDPYTIALSKLARGLESDIQDVVFLLRQGIIQMSSLERVVAESIPVAWDWDVDPEDLRRYLQEIQQIYQR